MATVDYVPTVEETVPPTIDVEVIGDTSTDLDHHTPDVVQVPQVAQKSKDINPNLTNVDTKIEVEESPIKDYKNKNSTKKSLSKHSSRENLEERVIPVEVYIFIIQ